MIALLLAHASAGVLINEVLYDSSASPDDGHEWIELCNNGSTAVDLTGYVVESGGSSFGECLVLGAGSIDPGEYVLVGAGSTRFPGAFDPALQNGGTNADGVRLLDSSGAVVDTVLYAGPAGSLTDDGGQTGRIAPEASADHSIGRWNGSGDCTDTDDAAADFSEYTTPSPGAANGDPDPDTGDTGDTGGGDVDCSAVDDVRLNELLSNPSGDDAGNEWVELFNRGAAPVNLSGWIVRAATKSTGGSSVTLPEGTELAAGGFLVVGAGGVGSFSSIGNGTGGDGVYLECGGTLVDAVVYGDDNADALTDDWGTVATSLAAVPGDGVSLSRLVDGGDTNESGVDWAESLVNTPGAANQPVVPPECHPEHAEGLKLNELMFDPTEDDASYEWVELYNAGTETVAIEGFVLEAAKSSWKVQATLPAGATLAPGAFYLIGAGDVPDQDYAAASLDLGQGGGADGVRLYSCDGVLLDTVLYGDDDNSDGLEGDGGATDVVDAPGAGSSIGRFPDGDDSDQHTDWIPYEDPTPRAPNADPGDTDDTGGDTDSGGDTDDTGEVTPGCGSSPEPERPDGACSTAGLPLRGLELALAALIVARRRARA